MKKILFILSLVIFASCEKEEVAPSAAAKMASGGSEPIVLTVKQKAGNSDTLVMKYQVNGVNMVKKTVSEEIVLDTILSSGDIITLDAIIKNNLGQVVTSAYRYTKITQKGIIGAGIICSDGKLNCSVYVNYTVK